MQSVSITEAHGAYMNQLRDEQVRERQKTEENERRIREDEGRRLREASELTPKPYQATKAPRYDAKTAQREHRRDNSGGSIRGALNTHFDSFLLGFVMLMLFVLFSNPIVN